MISRSTIDDINLVVHMTKKAKEEKGSSRIFFEFGGMESHLVFTIKIKCPRIQNNNHQALFVADISVVR